MLKMRTVGSVSSSRTRKSVSTRTGRGTSGNSPLTRRLCIEGAFYVWTRTEFDQVLGDDAEIAASFWNVKAKGNVDPSHDARDELRGKVRITYLRIEFLS